MSYLGNPPVVNASRLVFEAYATQGQTVITPPGGYTVGQVEVIINGSQLSGDDFVATDGSQIVLAQGLALNDTIKIVAFGTFAVANTYSQAQVDTKIATVNANIANIGPTFKNKIINGHGLIDQRNSGSPVTPSASATYTIDRWAFYGSQGSKLTYQRNGGGVTPPTGFSSYIGVTTASAYTVGSTDAFRLYQGLEGYNFADLGWGAAGASAATLSFWVRSSNTGTFGGCIYSGSGDQCYVFSYTINSANTWEYKTVTIPGSTSGTWVKDNGAFGYLQFSLGAGAANQTTAGSWGNAVYLAPTGQTSILGTVGNYLYVTGIQLEKGSTATSFDYRPYGTELALCQRYLPAYVGYQTIGSGICYASTIAGVQVKFPVTARVTPTGISVSAATDFNLRKNTGAGEGSTAITFNSWSTEAAQVEVTVASGLVQGNATILQAANGNAKLLFTGCEL